MIRHVIGVVGLVVLIGSVAVHNARTGGGLPNDIIGLLALVGMIFLLGVFLYLALIGKGPE